MCRQVRFTEPRSCGHGNDVCGDLAAGEADVVDIVVVVELAVGVELAA
jgi:hypothetical protein